MTRIADPDVLAELAADMPSAYVQCRELRSHAWQWLTGRRFPQEGRAERTLICERCEAKRHQTMTLQGEILSDLRDYPDGYLLHGVGRVDGSGAAVLRMAATNRMLDAQEAGEGVAA